MLAESLKKPYFDQPRDLYAEQRIAAALPKMEKSASDQKLKAAFQKHLGETQEQARRIEQICKAAGEKPTGKTCQATKGLIAETEESIGESKDPAVLDAALISGAQRVEHYEIAGHGTVISHAKLPGEDRALALLQQSLQEEKATDTSLTTLAESLVNVKAA